MTAADVEEASDPLVTSSLVITQRVLDAAAARGHGRIDDVILVGGSSRLPSVSQRLQAMLGIEPKLTEPDLAVAKGAALRAAQLAGTSRLRRPGVRAGLAASDSMVVQTVLPRSIGLLVEDSHDPSGKRSFVDHILDSNTPLPVTSPPATYSTILENQQTVRIQVFEQAGALASTEAEDNRRVLDGELIDLPQLPAGSPVNVTMSVGPDGRLAVTAREPSSGRELRLEAFVEGVVDSVARRRLSDTVRGIALED